MTTKRPRNALAVFTGVLMVMVLLVPTAASAAPPEAVTGVGAELSGVREITVTWSPPAGGDDVDDYLVTLNELSDETDDTTFTFSGLTPGQSYTATVRARNEEGVSDSMEAEPVVVPAEVPSAPVVTGTGVTAVTSTGFTVNWTPPLSDNGSAIIRYWVSLDGAPAIELDPDARSQAFTGRPSSTSHSVQIWAENVAGPGARATVSATTLAPPVAAPNAPALTASVDVGSITVSWPEPANNGAAILGYSATITPAAEEPRDLPPAARLVTFSGLAADTSYTVSVRARNSAGTSTPGSVIRRTPGVPGLPRNVKAESTAPFARSATVKWEPPATNGGAALTGYVVTLAGQTKEVAVAVTSVSFDALPPGSHGPSVRAVNGVGSGPTAAGPGIEVRLFAPFSTERAFVSQQYLDFLGRGPDAGGLGYWEGVTRADGSNIDAVVISFMRSPEFAPRRAVARLYLAYFDRRPDKPGLDFWASEMASGRRDLDGVSNHFARSNEFVQRYGSLSNPDFVALVYNNVLTRAPDAGGYAFWVGQLQGGMTRGQLMTRFSESPEFTNASSAAVDVIMTYNGMLGRQPDDDGFRFWVGRVGGQADALATLIRNFYASAEYAGRIRP